MRIWDVAVHVLILTSKVQRHQPYKHVSKVFNQWNSYPLDKSYYFWEKNYSTVRFYSLGVIFILPKNMDKNT